MDLLSIVQNVLKLQTQRKRKVNVDLVISNGNIILRSFRILEVDTKKKTFKGLTRQEEYISTREQREPLYCQLQFEDIKELYVPELGLEYLNVVFAARIL